ncbi:MAG: GreA/GreB family elongation factor [Chitinispirillaceae bacterium]|nr:GreA/GreB family elongation factor [Chitinispirillaceae bacterium]
MADNWKNGIFLCADPAAGAAACAKLDPQVRALLEANRPDEVEELLLNRAGDDPLDLRFFVPVLRHYAKNNKAETAQMFLDLLLDSCRSRSADEDELSLVRALLSAWPEAVTARVCAVEKLRRLYGDTPDLKQLVAHCRVLEAAEPLAALRALEQWLRYGKNRGVYMAGKGAGRISEINIALGTVRALFPDSAAPLSFKLDEAVRLLEPLPPGHFLLDAINRPEETRQLADADRRELLRRLFSSVRRPVSLNELKEMLAGIVGAEKWGAWWSDARKDRRLTVTAGNLCAWNDSAEDAEAGILEQFMNAPPRGRMEIARRCAGRSSSLVAAMSARLAEDAINERDRNPGLALELCIAAEKAENRDLLAVLLNSAEAAELIRNVQNRSARKRALALLRECRQDWPELYAMLIRTESDAQLSAMLYDALRENNGALLDGIVSETMSSPADAEPFFLWLCREMPVRTELQRHAGWQFLQLLLQLLTKNTMKRHQTALKKLFDDDGMFHQTMRTLDPEQAKQLKKQLDRDTVLEDYRRGQLLRDLRAWYPETHETREQTFYASAAAIRTRQQEYEKITGVDIPHNTEEIVRARAHGDLRENFEYHAARARQEMLSSRARTLHDELQRARPLERGGIDASAVCAGTAVRLAPAGHDAGSATITILGPWDSDPARGIISYQAPAARELLGRRKGEQVLFNGKPFFVEEITIVPSL